MHELSITQSILSITLRHAQEAGAVRVKELNLVIGELSSVIDESVQFYWSMIARGTIAADAVLNFKRLPAKLRCNDCAREFPMGERDYICPHCGSQQVVVSGGDEFFLESIDVDLAEEP
jgi:hydrogenase nickel incorporation protein HypA/HybF